MDVDDPPAAIVAGESGVATTPKSCDPLAEMFRSTVRNGLVLTAKSGLPVSVEVCDQCGLGEASGGCSSVRPGRSRLHCPAERSGCDKTRSALPSPSRSAIARALVRPSSPGHGSPAG